MVLFLHYKFNETKIESLLYQEHTIINDRILSSLDTSVSICAWARTRF
jgi:hypothetical protein